MGAHILIVEDEEKLARFVELELQHEGYRVSKAFNGRDALEKAVHTQYDLILLDIMLPGLNGLEVLRRLQQDNPTPVILLTARDAVMDKVAGLDAGAVDYITKPFAIEELLARIRVALKLHNAAIGSQEGENSTQSGYSGGNTGEKGAAGNFKSRGIGEQQSAGEDGIHRWRKLILDERRHRVTYEGHEIILTNREFQMLKFLLENQDIVLSRDVLLERVCGYDYVGETNIVDVYIRYLRAKIDEVYEVKMIETVRSVGYVIKSVE